jgi:hypothetical protein
MKELNQLIAEQAKFELSKDKLFPYFRPQTKILCSGDFHEERAFLEIAFEEISKKLASNMIEATISTKIETFNFGGEYFEGVLIVKETGCFQKHFLSLTVKAPNTLSIYYYFTSVLAYIFSRLETVGFLPLSVIEFAKSANIIISKYSKEDIKIRLIDHEATIKNN